MMEYDRTSSACLSSTGSPAVTSHFHLLMGLLHLVVAELAVFIEPKSTGPMADSYFCAPNAFAIIHTHVQSKSTTKQGIANNERWGGYAESTRLRASRNIYRQFRPMWSCQSPIFRVCTQWYNFYVRTGSTQSWLAYLHVAPLKYWSPKLKFSSPLCSERLFFQVFTTMNGHDSFLATNFAK